MLPDNLHPRSFFQFEALNVYLNMAAEAEEARAKKAQLARR